MVLRLGMDIDSVAFPQILYKKLYIVIGMLYHQVYVQRPFCRAGYIAHIVQGHGKIRNIASVHDIYMKRIDAAPRQIPYFPLQIAKIGTHHRCRQFKVHGSSTCLSLCDSCQEIFVRIYNVVVPSVPFKK